MAQVAVAAVATARPGEDVDGEEAWTADHRRMAIGLTADVRLLSLLGLRGGFDQGITPGAQRLTVRGGLAFHVLKPTIRPDLYAFADLGIDLATADGQIVLTSSEIAAGLGFRMRLGRHGLVGLEAGIVQAGLPPHAAYLPAVAQELASQTPRFGGQITVAAGAVF